MARVALYGNVGITRTYCEDCRRTALVLRGIKQCCDSRLTEDVNGVERIIQPEDVKRHPSRSEKIKILNRQHDRCLYCGRRFGSTAWYKGKQIVLRLNWDHVLPFEYSRDNSAGNFVAVCHICNHWKSDLIFTFLEEIQVYVTEKWERVETDLGKNLPGMRNQLPE
jgi:CRISPR/Cas system Type II protein with McrA/HNH and RuvC-like nuclease domain